MTIMLYVRHENRQAKFHTKQEAWAYAKQLHTDLDIYDSEQKAVVFASYRLSMLEGENWKVLGFARTYAPLRVAYAQAQPQTWALSKYDWTSKSWVSVKHS
jgi:hypothetical protein